MAHSFNTAVPGWLVLLPRRHVTAVHDLTDAEAGALGVWQVGLSRALRGVTGCLKTYVVQFAESEGFAHVHFHIVPRADLPAAHRGPGIFGLLDCPEMEGGDSGRRGPHGPRPTSPASRAPALWVRRTDPSSGPGGCPGRSPAARDR